MRDVPAGEEVTYWVTWLEMTSRPAYPRPQARGRESLLLIRAEAPPPWYFLALYDAVGARHEWTDWHRRPRADLEAFVGDPRVELYTLLGHGWPAGFFVLDTRDPAACNLAYFGLVPEAVGRGLGTYLLHTAIHMGWDKQGVSRLTVNTNTLDHPAALPLYQKSGFSPVRREEYRRVLTRPQRLHD